MPSIKYLILRRRGAPTRRTQDGDASLPLNSCRAFALFRLRSCSCQVFLQARHQLDEIAWAKAVVELVDEDAFPGVATGARRAGQREEIGAAGDTRRGPALDRRGPDLVIAEPAEEFAKAGNLLLVDAMKGLGRYVAAGHAGAARRNDDVDIGIGDPLAQLRDDPVLLVADDAARSNLVSGRRGEIGECVPGPVLCRVAGVGHGQ